MVAWRVTVVLTFFSDWQRFVLEMLRMIVAEPDLMPEGFWQERAFEPFVLRFFQYPESSELPEGVGKHNLGPYQEILDNWNDPVRLGDAITHICDYHCENIFQQVEARTASRSLSLWARSVQLRVAALSSKRGWNPAIGAYTWPLI